MNKQKLFAVLTLSFPQVVNRRHGIVESLASVSHSACDVAVLEIHKKSFVKSADFLENLRAEEHKASGGVGYGIRLVLGHIQHTVFGHKFSCRLFFVVETVST